MMVQPHPGTSREMHNWRRGVGVANEVVKSGVAIIAPLSWRKLSGQRKAIRCRDLLEIRGFFSHESSCLVISRHELPISYQLGSDGICRNRALSRWVPSVASKVVNTPCFTT